MMRTVLLGLCAALWMPLAAAETCDPPAPAADTRLPEIQIQGTDFVDARGRVMTLRGINVSGDAKVPPFLGVTAGWQLDPLPDWGFTTLRLLFTWEAFEPAPCDYDDTYLQYYEQVTRWAHERGLWVIVDFHQDAFSRFSTSGCGEGFPAWAVHSSIPRREPKNDASCESWGIKMLFDLNHHRAWHHFHQDSEGARTRFLAMVERVAHRMAQHPNVIGYDVLNEPWGTNGELLRLYEDTGRALRRQDPHAMLFVPPHAFLSSGLVPNGIPRPELTNFAYAPHYYDPIMITLKWWLGNRSAAPLNEMGRQAQAWGVPLILGEFGAPAGTRGGTAYIAQIYDWLDTTGAASAHWNYTPNWQPHTKDGWNDEDLSITDDTGTLRDNMVVRPYVVAWAGVPGAMTLTEDRLTVRWTHDPLAGATELFLPADGWLTGTWQSEGVDCTPLERGLRCDGGAGAATLIIDKNP